MKPKTGNVKSCEGRSGIHLEGQSDTHVLLAHPDDAHVGADDEARVVGHMAWAARGGGDSGVRLQVATAGGHYSTHATHSGCCDSAAVKP